MDILKKPLVKSVNRMQIIQSQRNLDPVPTRLECNHNEV